MSKPKIKKPKRPDRPQVQHVTRGRLAAAAVAALLAYAALHLDSRFSDPGLTVPPTAAVVHRFTNDAVALALETRQPLPSRRGSEVAMEIRRIEVPSDAGATMYGVFVATDSHFEAGDLVGCYTGAVVHGDALAAKKQSFAPDVDTYTFDINDTHFLDPTSATGRLDDTEPPFRVEMAGVNEPAAGPPNLTPLDYAFGLCHDRWGALGAPYYAARRIEGGEELLVCYGAAYRRAYVSDCADEPLSEEWTRRDYARIYPHLTAPRGG